MATAGKSIVVTGASRGEETNEVDEEIYNANLIMILGIGLAIANALLRTGHRVVVQARSASPLEKLQAKFPKQVRVVVGDIASSELPKQVIDLALKEFGQLDGVVINHGILSPVAKIAECNVEAWRKSFDVNFFSAVALVSETR